MNKELGHNLGKIRINRIPEMIGFDTGRGSAGGRGESREISVGGLNFAPDRRLISRDGEEINLTDKESQLFMILAEPVGRIVWKDDITGKIWPNEAKVTDRFNTLVKRLRGKIEPDPRQPVYIHSLRERYWIGELSRKENRSIDLPGSDVVYFPDGRIVQRDGVNIELSVPENRILMELVDSQGISISRADLKRRAWPGRSVRDVTLQSHISRLREKLQFDPGDPGIIQSKPRVGYRIGDEGGRP